MLRTEASLTGQYLSGKKSIAVPTNRRLPADRRAGQPLDLGGLPSLQVHGARQHNLKNIDVSLPLGTFIAVTGVSGSGKSSLINEVLYNTSRKLHRARMPAAAHDEILGLEQIDKVINVDQDPIGNSPLSNPATYTGVFDLVRQLFAQLPEAKIRGYQPRRFSFTRPGGRCEACEGNGKKKIEMHFLPTSGSSATSAAASPTTPKRWRSASRDVRLPTSWKCASAKRWSCSPTCRRSARC